MNIKEESLKKVLSELHIPELPKQAREDCGEYWLEAVVLVRKRDASQSYAVGKRGADGKIRYAADYGSMSQIVGLISIHPYMYLEKRKYMPYDTIEQKRIALANFIGGDEAAKQAVAELSDSEVEYKVLEIAIGAQYNSNSIAATHDDIIAAVKGIGKDMQIEDAKEMDDVESPSDSFGGDVSPKAREKKNKSGRPRKTSTKQ